MAYKILWLGMYALHEKEARVWGVAPIILLVCLFDLIIYVQLTIFQLNRDRSSWVEPVGTTKLG